MNEYFQHLLHEFDLPLSNPILVFSLILLIILLSPILLRKLNVPGVIGLIISGVIIGPYGFYILEKNSAVELFSTIGLLYIMFIAGLELDLNEFRANRNKSVVFGLLTFILPISIGFPVCYYGLGYDLNASILISSMFATHTLVAYPIVSKLGIAKNQAVAITVGGTILTDTAVLIILAVIMGNHTGTLDAEFWTRLGVSLAIFSGVMFFIIPRISKWFFRKLESEKQAHYIYVLSVVFFAAFLAEVVGLEPIIGAFMAGLALNKLIPHSSALMNRIEFIGNSLFIPFFLISVGMLVDIRVILKGHEALLVAGTLIIVALFAKWIAAYFTQRIFSYSSNQRQLIFGLSSAHAAATLAIILVGYKAEIIDENILNGTILLILITCVVASFATEKAAKNILIKEGNPENRADSTKSFLEEHILVSSDDHTHIPNLLELSFYMKDSKSLQPVSLLTVVPNDELAEMNIIRSRQHQDAFVKQGAAFEIKVNALTTIDHNPANGIARISREVMANLILVDWPVKESLLDRIIGEQMGNMISCIDKNLLICDVNIPFVSHTRLLLITPPLSEMEFGFRLWLIKILRVARELSIPVVNCGDARSFEAVNTIIRSAKLNVSLSHVLFEEWDDFLLLSREFKSTDLLVFASARKGSISYTTKLDPIPMKLEKYFPEINKIVIYPQQNDQNYKNEQYNDFSNSPLSRGIETIENFGKELGSIFRKDKN